MDFDPDDEYNIYVQDIKSSVDFYKQAFKLHETMRFHSKDEKYIVAFLKSRGSPHAIEMICYDDKARESPVSAYNGPQLTFITRSYDEAYALHKSMGCICYDEKEPQGSGRYQVKDPDGRLIRVSLAEDLRQEGAGRGAAGKGRP